MLFLHTEYLLSEVYSLEPGRFVPGGDLQPGIRDFETCFYSCVYTQTCKAFVFDAYYNLCHFHMEDAACDVPQKKFYCIFVRLSQCGKCGGILKNHSTVKRACHL